MINLYISYTQTSWLRNSNTDFTLNNCLVGTKNADPDKYKYSGYGIRFDSRSVLSFTDGNTGRKVIIFGADMSSSVHIDNKRKYILILDKGPTQGVDYITLTAEAAYSINFTKPNKRFVLILH